VPTAELAGTGRHLVLTSGQATPGSAYCACAWYGYRRQPGACRSRCRWPPLCRNGVLTMAGRWAISPPYLQFQPSGW